MGIWSSFKTGLATTRHHWRMLLLLFIINLIAAILLTMPLNGFLDQTIVNSSAADKIAFNMNFDYLSDLIINYSEAFNSVFSSSFIMTAVILYLLIGTFLAGGILGSFHSGEKFSLKSFFGFCGKYFWAFFRLLLIGLLFFVVIVLIYKGIGKGFSALLGDSPNEPLVFALFVIRHAIFLFLFLFLTMVFDYAKIRAVVKGGRSMWRVALGSFSFVFHHSGRTLGLYYFIGIAGVAVFAAYFSIAHYLIPATMVIGLLIWQQLYSAARMGIRMLFYSSQLELYRSLY
jgi:hypothetical protein